MKESLIHLAHTNTHTHNTIKNLPFMTVIRVAGNISLEIYDLQ